MKRLAFILSLIIGGSLILTGPVQAAWETRSEDTVIIKKNDTVKGDLWCSGSSVIIDGTVDGDLLVAASRVTVTGVVKGDIIGFVGDYIQDGKVEGNLRVVASNVKLQGTIGRNISAWYVQAFRMARRASVQDMWVSGLWNTGLLFEMDGKVHGNLEVSAIDVTIGGQVDGNSVAMTDNETGIIRVKPGAKLGPLSYTGRSLERTGATVGAVEKIPPVDDGRLGMVFRWIWFLGTLMIGFIFIGFIPTRVIEWAAGDISWGRTILTGILILLGVPAVGVLLFLTGLGIPLAFFLGLIYAAMLIVSQLPAYIFFGAAMVRLFRLEKRFPVIFLLLIGGIIIFFLSTLPVGFYFGLMASALGLGLLVRRPRGLVMNPPSTGTDGNA